MIKELTEEKIDELLAKDSVEFTDEEICSIYRDEPTSDKQKQEYINYFRNHINYTVQIKHNFIEPYENNELNNNQCYEFLMNDNPEKNWRLSHLGHCLCHAHEVYDNLIIEQINEYGFEKIMDFDSIVHIETISENVKNKFAFSICQDFDGLKQRLEIDYQKMYRFYEHRRIASYLQTLSEFAYNTPDINEFRCLIPSPQRLLASKNNDELLNDFFQFKPI